MIKNCKITKIINPPIYGVTKEPIKEGNIVPLNSGQILACLGISVVDEILQTGAIVRLNRDNYLKDNSGITEEIVIKDAVVEEEPIKPVEKTVEPVKEETVEEIVGQDPIEDQKELKENVVKGEKLPEVSNEEKEAPATEEKSVEVEKTNNKNTKNNNQKKKK